MKLELKHLAPYLPYGLNVVSNQLVSNKQYKMVVSNHTTSFDNGLTIADVLMQQAKPVLFSLEDINKQYHLKSQNVTIIPLQYISTSKADSQQIMERIQRKQRVDVFEYWKIERLLELHFDVFGLLDSGLAIDINTITKSN